MTAQYSHNFQTPSSPSHDSPETCAMHWTAQEAARFLRVFDMRRKEDPEWAVELDQVMAKPPKDFSELE